MLRLDGVESGLELEFVLSSDICLLDIVLYLFDRSGRLG